MNEALPPPGSGASPELEREAVERLLASGMFERAPGLEALVRYICQKHFEGKSDEIKEYNIAVEALGRPADFDKRRDSIVRVEAHRLRKRLQAHYESGAGATEVVQILLPEGSYVPRFRYRDLTTDQEPAPEAEQNVPEPPAAARKTSRVQWLLIGSALIPLLAVLFWLGWTRARPEEVAAAAPAPEEQSSGGPAALPPGREIRILAGRGQGVYIDRYGQEWQGDRYFKGGNAVTTRHQEVQGLDRNYFGGMRMGDFEYEIPLGAGSYELQLIFAETEVTGDSGEGERNFDVALNGRPLLTHFDVVQDAGGASVATVRTFKDVSPGKDGRLRLHFQSSDQKRAFVNAISVLPAQPGRIRPIRLVTRKEPYRDADGNTWLPDRFVRSGVVITRPTVPAATPNPELYRAERYGKFTYTLPVAPGGTYALKLYFTEFWFGPTAPGGGGPGSRIFRVYCNHQLLLDDFDLYREAGGTGRALVKVFRNLKPDWSGKLALSFEPVANYALINAIEVIDESPESLRSQR